MAVVPSLQDLRAAYESLDKIHIEDSYSEYISHLPEDNFKTVTESHPKPGTLHHWIQNNPLRSLVPMTILFQAIVATNPQELEQIPHDKIRTNDDVEDRVQVKPLESVNLVLAPGSIKVKKKKKKRHGKSKEGGEKEGRKRKRKKRHHSSEDGEPPKKKKKRERSEKKRRVSITETIFIFCTT
jgi:hypothetical protein